MDAESIRLLALTRLALWTSWTYWTSHPPVYMTMVKVPICVGEKVHKVHKVHASSTSHGLLRHCLVKAAEWGHVRRLLGAGLALSALGVGFGIAPVELP